MRSRDGDWSAFEDEVATLLALQGYDVERDRTMGGRQADVLARMRMGPSEKVVLIECKFTQGTTRVGARQVTEFLQHLTTARSAGLVDQGMLVTNVGFTRPASDVVRELGAQRYAHLRTFAELEASLLDLGRYLQDLVSDFRDDALAHYLVDLECEELIDPTIALAPDEDCPVCGYPHAAHLDRLHDPELTNVRMRDLMEDAPESRLTSVYDLGYFADHLVPKRHKSLKGLVTRWLRTPENHVCLLGDYGSGKTSFMRYIAAELAAAHLQAPFDTRIPILLPLKEYSLARSMRALITDWLVNQHNVSNYHYRLFQRMLEQGRFILLLDGFDEMTSGAPESIRQSFGHIAEIYAPKGKVILSGRPGYFPDLLALNQAIHWNPQLITIRALSAGGAPTALTPYKLVQVLPLTWKHINLIVQKRRRTFDHFQRTPEELLALLQGEFDLADLATRPVLLDIVIATFCHMGSDAIVSKSKYSLYRSYVQIWLDREREKTHHRREIAAQDLEVAVEELAWTLHNQTAPRIHHSALEEQVIDASADLSLLERFAQGDDADRLAREVRIASFLGRDAEGYYSFLHKSFLEYFVAARIGRRLAAGDLDPLIECVLTAEVLDFLAGRIDVFSGATLPHLYDALSLSCNLPNNDEVTEVSRVIDIASAAFLLLAISERGLPSGALKGVSLRNVVVPPSNDLREHDWSNSRLSGVTMSRCNLSGSHLNEAAWVGVDVRAAIATGSAVRASTLYDLNAEAAILANSVFSDGDLRGCQFERADLSAATVDTCRGHNVSFRGTDLSKATFRNTEITLADFRNANLTGTTFIDCKFPGARYDDPHFPA